MKVWVLVIDNRHGTTVTAHPSEASCDAANFAYVDQSWENSFSEPRPTDDAKELVRVYWERQSSRGDEWYVKEEADIGDLQFPPILITENTFGVKPGFYTRPDIVRLLHMHAASMLAVRFIAKAIGGEQ